MTSDSCVADYFAVEPLPQDVTDWTSLAALGSDPSVLEAKLGATAHALGTREPRVAASIDFRGVMAQVLSPALAWTYGVSACSR